VGESRVFSKGLLYRQKKRFNGEKGKVSMQKRQSNFMSQGGTGKAEHPHAC